MIDADLYSFTSGEAQHVNASVEALYKFYRPGIADSFNFIKWNNTVVTDLQEAINDAANERGYCTINRVRCKFFFVLQF